MAYTGIPEPFTDQTPFNQMHVYQWGNNQVNRKDVTIKNYLDSLGFVIGMDKLNEGEYKRLDYAIDAWHRTRPYIHEVMLITDVFTPTAKGGGRFWVSGLAFARFANNDIEVKVRKAITEAGWIYDINPETTYFEIVGNRLYARYQQIIGSRFIMHIKD